MKYIYDLHKIMLNQNLILVYEGEFTQEITKSVLAMAERNMDSFGEEGAVKRKVFNIMVECLQNITKHAVSHEEDSYGKNSAIFMIGKHQDEYIITSGNSILNEDVEGMIKRLENINSLDKEGLKELYKGIIKRPEGLSPKGGAGLGFVDMARKSGNKLGFDFERINDKLTFFALKTVISRQISKDV
ncbi:MAG: hypothetical protein EAZ08_11040 [Cytophagales bacterium]|nr:MAG: hypothetical protein EAZ08_11040 [Cytophagales bacterium]